MKLLITGATGFIGSRLVRKLMSDHELFCLTRQGGALPHHAHVHAIAQNLGGPLDPSRLPASMDAIIHLAQSRQFRRFPEQAGDIFTVNTASTAQLLEYGRQAKIRSFVFASSGGVCGYLPRPIVETDPPQPNNFYLACKYAAECLVNAYGDYFATGLQNQSNAIAALRRLPTREQQAKVGTLIEALKVDLVGARRQVDAALDGDVERFVATLDAAADSKDAVADAAGKDGEKPKFFYAEQSQQNKYACESCGSVQDILGKYGFCSSGGTRNDLMVVRASLKVVKKRVEAEAELVSCLKDTVTEFDSAARAIATEAPGFTAPRRRTSPA